MEVLATRRISASTVDLIGYNDSAPRGLMVKSEKKLYVEVLAIRRSRGVDKPKNLCEWG